MRSGTFPQDDCTRLLHASYHGYRQLTLVPVCPGGSSPAELLLPLQYGVCSHCLLQLHGQPHSNGSHNGRCTSLLSGLCLLQIELSGRRHLQRVTAGGEGFGEVMCCQRLTKNTVPPPTVQGVEFWNSRFLATSTPGESTPPINLCGEKYIASLATKAGSWSLDRGFMLMST